MIQQKSDKRISSLFLVLFAHRILNFGSVHFFILSPDFGFRLQRMPFEQFRVEVVELNSSFEWPECRLQIYECNCSALLLLYLVFGISIDRTMHKIVIILQQRRQSGNKNLKYCGTNELNPTIDRDITYEYGSI